MAIVRLRRDLLKDAVTVEGGQKMNASFQSAVTCCEFLSIEKEDALLESLLECRS